MLELCKLICKKTKRSGLIVLRFLTGGFSRFTSIHQLSIDFYNKNHDTGWGRWMREYYTQDIILITARFLAGHGKPLYGKETNYNKIGKDKFLKKNYRV